LRNARGTRASDGHDAAFELDLGRSSQQPLHSAAVDIVAILVGHTPAHANKGASYSLVGDSRSNGFEVRLPVAEDIDGSPCRRGLEGKLSAFGADLPQEKTLVPFLTLVEASDRAWICDQPPAGLPALVAVNMTGHKRLRPSAE
jgi:hypothetical protein